MLRSYQQAAFEATKAWLKESREPCIIESATGSGKSHIVAAIAEWVNSTSGKKVLCLAPSKELTEQNHAKFLAVGEPASFFSASIGKSLKHDVVFGTPQTVKNSIKSFCGKFACVIIDEAHGITPTIKTIIDHMRAQNNNLRVIGLSATPYRLGSGYIYKIDENNKPVPEAQAREPFFHKLICKITARELIELGFLTPPATPDDLASGYSTSSLELNAMGKFDSKQVEQAFEGMGRKTSGIVSEIVRLSASRMGVIIFAATIRHAKEVLESLPEGSKMVSGSTNKKEREQILTDFKAQRIKYLVNVAVLTTGFDAPHVDVVCLLRATESVGLMQQMIGRGLRLHDNKTDCLILDYAENIERHCPDGDIFDPTISVLPARSGTASINVTCPLCGTDNEFTMRENPEDFGINESGYFVDLMGEEIKTDDEKAIPAHFGRRCFGHEIISGSAARCEYRWSYKECPDCNHENDIAARFCEACEVELIDPNEKLRLEFQKIKNDPYSITSDAVKSWSCKKHISAAGNDTLRIDYVTECRAFSTWYLPRKKALWANLCESVFGKGKIAPDVDSFLAYVNYGEMPFSVTVKRDRGSKFYSVYSHNRPVNEAQ